MSSRALGNRLPVADPAQVRAAAVHDLGADRPAVIGLIIVNALASAAALVGPWLLGRIIDTIHTGSGAVLGTVDRLALAALLFTVAQTLLSRWALRIGYRFGERAVGRVRERFLKRTLALPPQVADQLPTGDLITRGGTDAATVASALRGAVPEVLVAIIHALFLIIAVVLLDPLLGVCGIGCLMGALISIRWYQRRARPAYLAVAASGAELADVVAGTARGARTIELLALAERRSEITETAIGRARSARLAALWLRTVLFSWVEISLVLPVVAVLLIGGALYLHGFLTLGVVVAAAVYLRQLSGPMDTLMLWIEQLQGAGASYARVEGLTGVVPAPSDSGHTGDSGHLDTSADSTGAEADLGDRIRVQGATFSYTGNHDVLHGIDLLVRPGERLAIVGTSGAGKSTLARLLAGLDRPRTGSVTIAGTPVADLAPDRLREHIILVTQDHHVFHDTVRDNLLIAKPAADEDDLRSALAAVGADWIADLPHALDTEIGTDTSLDDASAQQLSLARVVLADPHTVILDEATALLGPGAARRTEQSLAAVLRGRTVIAIAHRLQTAHDADRIAVMEAGELVEVGTHDQLVDADATYGRLWRAWHADAGSDVRSTNARPASVAPGAEMPGPARRPGSPR